MTISIIVARYNENVEWTKQFPNVYIYNKGTPLGDGYNEILMTNVGREGHSYYKYICNNYENLCNNFLDYIDCIPINRTVIGCGSLNNKNISSILNNYVGICSCTSPVIINNYII